MRTSIYIIALITSVYFFQSCSPAMNVRNSNKRSGIIRVKQFTDRKTTLMWAHHDPTQRQTLMHVDENGNIKVLAEQSPDAGITRNIEIDPKVKIEGKVDAELLVKTQAELSKLTNRTTSLMITREALYRLSEGYFNGAVDKDKYIELYKEVITQSIKMIEEESKLEAEKAKTAKAEAERVKAETDLEKEKIKEKTTTKEEENNEDKKGETKKERETN